MLIKTYLQMMMPKIEVMKMSNTYGSSIYEYQPTYGIKKCPNLDDYDLTTSSDDENNNLYEHQLCLEIILQVF